MAYSKIFSGDLPELTDDIVKYFRNDYKTLHSCVLVNRVWCRLAIPLLWRDPFSIPIKNYHFIEIYLHNLNEEDKTKLNEYGINKNLFPTTTLFNYPSFIQRLNTFKIGDSIEKWITAVKTNPISNSNSNYSTQKYLNIKRLINKSLFKIFIENEASLHTFEIMITNVQDHDQFNDVSELILKNPNFIYNIRNFKLQRIENVKKISSFLEILCSKCNSISFLYFQFQKFNNDNDFLVKKYLTRIINSQHNLKKISFEHHDFPLNEDLLLLNNSLLRVLENSLSLLTNSNCSNTLRTIIFNKINFKNIGNLKEAFERLNVLESVHILYCRFLNYEFVHQIIQITKPFKLKSLFMDEILSLDSLELLLQKSGDYLENFGIGSTENDVSLTNIELKQKLFNLIIKYCTKIELFDLFDFDNKNIYLTFQLIEHIEQSLNYLSIDLDFDNNQLCDGFDLSSIILSNLGQILPLRLEYLSLTLMISSNVFEIFLKNSQNTFIKKLLIKNMRKNENILPLIKNYVMKKKRVEYLAIKDGFFKYEQHDVKEFGLYNIEIRNYDELYIQVVDLIKEKY
ncbi:hypothetical protein C1645_829425 [Glomus cerebriforme]|uniref:F-box domain-containing protein n=1 Tax=Glomus cerebriforme TaxID=658196 RepID=A0A397SJK3_9GLOM|nr:hypothetical protein C1645_829425 [Glomus cerebriforme]